MDPVTIGIGSAVVFFGAMVQGATGFGFALVATPILMQFLDPLVVVPSVLLISMLSNTFVLVDGRKHVSRDIVRPLVLGGLFGVPVGTWILYTIDGRWIAIAVGILVVVFSVVLFSGWRVKVKRPELVSVPVGFFASMCGAAITIGGPPIVLFLSNQVTPKNVFRASIVVVFLVLNVLILTLQAFTGILTLETAGIGAIFLPSLVVGSLSGIYLSRRIPEELFRRLTLIIVALNGAGLAISKGLFGAT